MRECRCQWNAVSKRKKITNKLKIIDCDKHRNWRGPNPILTLQTLVALLYSSVVPKSHRRTDTRDSHSAKPRKWNRMNRAKKKIQLTRWWLHHNNSTYINVKRCYNKEIAQWARITHTCAMATATLPHSQNRIYTRNLYILYTEYLMWTYEIILVHPTSLLRRTIDVWTNWIVEGSFTILYTYRTNDLSDYKWRIRSKMTEYCVWNERMCPSEYIWFQTLCINIRLYIQ